MRTYTSIGQSSAVKIIICLVLVAAVLVGAGIFMFMASTKAHENGKVFIDTEAVIEKIIEGEDDTDTAYVKYIVDGKEYNNVQYSGYTSSMKVGDTVTIEYNRDNPSEIRNDLPALIAYVFWGIAGLCLLGVLFIFILAFANRGKKSDFIAAMNQGTIEEVKR
ncbi:MAG: DUF3592 domain-containing protein [Clostridia bacterium]|nr:DUF3592 domain-containing protein [Clostridia bacterium]